MRPSEDQLKRSVVVAPLAGVVVDLRIHTTGGVIAPGAPMLDIVITSYSIHYTKLYDLEN